MDKTRITNANKNNYMPAGLRGRAIKEINMDRDTIIDGLRMTMDLCVFDPSTGEEIEPHLLNDISRATYDACKGALEILEQLPPAQPEIIRCKDCKHFKQVFAPHDNDGLCGHWHSKCDARTSQEGYCSHAERREVTT